MLSIPSFTKKEQKSGITDGALKLFEKIEMNYNSTSELTLNKYLKVKHTKFDQSSKILIDHDLFMSMYLIELNSIQKINSFSKIEYKNTLDLYFKTMNIYTQFNDINKDYSIQEPYQSRMLSDFHCQYIRYSTDDDFIILQIVHMGDSSSHADINLMIKEGLANLDDDIVDALIVPIDQFMYLDTINIKKYKIIDLKNYKIIVHDELFTKNGKILNFIH